MLHAFRAIFVVICAIFGSLIGQDVYKVPSWEGVLAGAIIGATCAAFEWIYARRFIAILSTVMFGVVVGFIVSFFIIQALNLIPALSAEALPPTARVYRDLGITFVFCFLSVLSILHAKDDFKIVIPFIQLKAEGKTARPLVLDTSAIIDGRIADVLDTRVIDTPVIIPQFVLVELQQVADSADALKRGRGRRGLDILNRLRGSKAARVEVHDVLLPEIQGVDAKLVAFAKRVDGRLVTHDYNLNKVAQASGIDVVNVNDLAAALKPTLLQGDKVAVKLVKRGESAGQAVGYLDDGTMVVAEDCIDRIGQETDLVVTNVRQTSMGRMIFSRSAEAPARR
jgi:uncharacterized protein YacL